MSLADYPKYTGIDVSKKAIEICLSKFKNENTKIFLFYDPKHFCNNGMIKGDLALSLDVIYHLIEDEIFEKYMKDVFRASTKYVIIYSTDFEKSFSKIVMLNIGSLLDI